MTIRRAIRFLLPLLALLAAGCGDEERAASNDGTQTWAEVMREARGQTVSWWLFGGDARINDYLRRHVEPAARRAGITVKRVPVTDTADAVQRVVAQRRAGRTSGGAVDLIWINGENFAAGKRADLWLEDWADDLPNARLLDRSDPSIARDFQVPVDGQESPWSRASFVFATDTARVEDPPEDLDALLAYAREHPGRFTYPAPPDFTGSAFVRQVVQAKGEDAAFEYLRELKPLMHRAGEALPRSEAELADLFGNGEVDFAMSYDANFVLTAVRKGQFPESARPFVLDGGTLSNVSFVTIPADAAHPAAAKVLANLLLDAELQAIKADPEVLGIPSVLAPGKLPDATRNQSPYVLGDPGPALQELPADAVGPLEDRWKREILR